MVRVLLFLICLLSSGCVFAEDPGIQCMVVGDQVLEVQENRQLTHYSDGKVSDVCISPDGRYVIYRVADDSPGGRIKAAIVKASGGRSTVVMDGPGSEPDEGELAQRDGVWVPGVWRLDHGANPWSPDGSLVAFPAVHVVMDQNGGREECWIVVKNNTGVQRTAFQLANGVRVMETPIFWSPDGRKLAVVEQPEIEVGQAGKTLRICLLVLDIFKGTVQMVPCGSQPPDLLGWTRDGKSLLYSVQAGDRTELREATVEGGAVRVITDKYRPQGLSPNGAWRVVNDDEGIKLEEVSSGDKTNVTGNVRAEFIGWAPNGRMFLYRRPETIRDNTAERHTDLRTLWMSSVAPGKLNHMCLAFDADSDSDPSWSADCMKLAYESNGRAYVAELAVRIPSASEKLMAGLPLTEDEEKSVLLNSAKEIGVSLFMYALDHGGDLPSADTLKQDLSTYCKRDGLFYRPGTQQDAFQYFPQANIDKIEDPASTVLGRFDVGYGWIVDLYADSHVRTDEKK